MMRAATIDSSRARLIGCFPWACDRTTVRRCRLMLLPYLEPEAQARVAHSLLARRAPTGKLHMPLEHVLRLFPAGGQEVMIFLDRQGVGVISDRGHFEQPPVAIVIDVDR